MQRIDPRAPRLGAAITSVLAIAGFILTQLNQSIGLAILATLTLLFAWSLVSPKTHPYSMLFRSIRPLLQDPEFMEDPRPPRFAQQVGLSVSIFGLLIAVIDPLIGTLIGLGIVFIASALNAYFDFCLGCVVYLRIKRAQRALAQ
jgi:hypothetical protein